MSDRDPTLDLLRQIFAPDPTAVDRVVEHALAPQDASFSKLFLVTAAVLLTAGTAIVTFSARQAEKATLGGLSNRGSVYVSRSGTGVSIHNNPQPEPTTFQIISTGDPR